MSTTTLAFPAVDADTGAGAPAAPGAAVEVVTLRACGVERTVRWGQSWHLGSAAYWVSRCRETARPEYLHSFGATLVEEVAACVLGGHGIPAEIGLAAYAALRERGLFAEGVDPTGDELEAALREPLSIGDRTVRYRFAAQRGHRLAKAMEQMRGQDYPRSATGLRDWLLRLPGVGPKTASWVVRNHLGSDEVAIIDVHVLRAGVIAGVYSPDWTPARHYGLLEELFLAWAAEGQVSAAALDAIVWADMAGFGRSVFSALGVPGEGWSWYSA
jgi:N-glycosylase/DNA lyase